MKYLASAIMIAAGVASVVAGTVYAKKEARTATKKPTMDEMFPRTRALKGYQ